MRHDNERGSIAFVMLVTMIGMALGALLVPMIVGQSHSTSHDQSRVRSLSAAETGVDVALGLVRSAVGPSVGDTTKLPCGPLSGNVNSAGSASYQVSIAYYIADPGGKSPTWQHDNQMLCVSGYGPYDPNTKTYVPSFVLLTSTGSEGAADSAASSSRTLQSTYVVKTTNSNIIGGQIKIYPAGGDQYCMDAGSAPALNAQVYLQPCSTSNPPLPQQVWSYNSDLSIQLMSTVGDTTLNPNGNGLCLSAGTSHAAGNPMYLVKCAPPKNATYALQWSIDDNSHLQGTNDQSGLDGNCIQVDTQGPNVLLEVDPCAGGTTDTKQTWVPTPSVGVGAAGAPDPPPAGWISTPHQLVNFLQFGRCLDVSNQRVVTDPKEPDSPGGDQFLILYSCKQSPTPGGVAWNQKWAYNSQGEWVTNNGSAYCLSSPGTVGGHVTVKPCPATATSDVKWTNNLTQDASGNELSYADKFTTKDSYGNCLSLSANDDNWNGYLKATVATCDGSAAQKWNAQPNLQSPVVQNTIEK